MDKSPQGIYLHSYCTVFDNEEVIEKVFKGKGVKVRGENGSVEVRDGKLWIRGDLFWERNMPDMEVVDREIEGLIGYEPQVKKHRTISY